jgi:hypothetical protein
VTSRTVADRAASNGGWSSVTAYSRTIIAASGTPGASIAATRTQRARSQATMTARRGSRSARPDRNIPPSRYGRNPDANVTEASSGDFDRSYTRSVSATTASRSPAMDRT